MVSDEMGKRLHDHAKRVEVLSAEERAQLQAWYPAQDRTESDQLSLAEPADTATALQAQEVLCL